MTDLNSAEGYAQALAIAEQQLAQWLDKHPDQFPIVSNTGLWCGRSADDSAAGDEFLVGLMWELYRETDKECWLKNAQHYGKLLEESSKESPQTTVPTFLYSHLPWFEVTKDRYRRAVTFQAAAELAARFHHKGRFLSTVDRSDELSMRGMMEVPVMFYAANETLDQDMARHATAHCRTTRSKLLAEDGAARHSRMFDVAAGKFDQGENPESASAESCQSRDVALALLGFSQVYGLTSAAEFLKVAETCAEYWLAHLPPDHVPFTHMPAGDESMPSDVQRDVTSGAMAACTLLELAEQTRVAEHAAAYRSTGLAMLDVLAQPPYLALKTQGGEGILRREGYAASENGVCGDFFFVKGLRLGQVQRG